MTRKFSSDRIFIDTILDIKHILGEKTMQSDKSKYELYQREILSMAEKIYQGHIIMRKAINEFEKIKYNYDDKYINSNEYKLGFIAGVKAMSSIIKDL